MKRLMIIVGAMAVLCCGGFAKDNKKDKTPGEALDETLLMIQNKFFEKSDEVVEKSEEVKEKAKEKSEDLKKKADKQSKKAKKELKKAGKQMKKAANDIKEIFTED